MCDEKWTMSDEREFMENLLCSRFNFFLVFVSLVVAGAISASSMQRSSLVLSFGSLISIPLAGTIARAQMKLNLALKSLFAIENHPTAILNKACEERFAKKGGLPSMRNWIGYWTPALCCLCLIVATIRAWTICLK